MGGEARGRRRVWEPGPTAGPKPIQILECCHSMMLFPTSGRANSAIPSDADGQPREVPLKTL